MNPGLKHHAAVVLILAVSFGTHAQPVKDGGTEFKATYCAKPVYPAQDRREGAEGQTLISYLVDSEGLVTEARVLKPSGESKAHEALDRLALRAVKACRFREAIGYGMGTIEFAWRLKD